MDVLKAVNWKTLIHLEEWAVWVFWFFGVCLIPILVTPLFSNVTITFSSLLAYCFTLMAVNVYLFDQIVTSGLQETLWLPKLRKYLGIAVMVASIVCFLVYNLDDGVNTTLNDHITKSVLVAAVPVFIIALTLNVPLIRKQANETIARHERKRIDKTKEGAENIHRELEEEEIS